MGRNIFYLLLSAPTIPNNSLTPSRAHGSVRKILTAGRRLEKNFANSLSLISNSNENPLFQLAVTPYSRGSQRVRYSGANSHLRLHVCDRHMEKDGLPKGWAVASDHRTRTVDEFESPSVQSAPQRLHVGNAHVESPWENILSIKGVHLKSPQFLRFGTAFFTQGLFPRLMS